MRPTLEQARVVYESMDKPSVRKLRAKLVEMGYTIGTAAVGRWIAGRFEPSPHQTRRVIKGASHSIPDAPTVAAAIVGSELSPEEASLLEQDMAELKALEVPALKAMMEKERLVYNIMLMRFSQRSADRLAMAPQASAAMVKAMAEADTSISQIPICQPHLNGHSNGHMIDVTPNEQNEVSNAIGLFLKQEGVAA